MTTAQNIGNQSKSQQESSGNAKGGNTKKPTVDELYGRIEWLEKENKRLSLTNEQLEDEVETQKDRADRLATRQADKVEDSVVWAAVGRMASNFREGVVGESEELAEACHRAEQVKQLVAQHEKDNK